MNLKCIRIPKMYNHPALELCKKREKRRKEKKKEEEEVGVPIGPQLFWKFVFISWRNSYENLQIRSSLLRLSPLNFSVLRNAAGWVACKLWGWEIFPGKTWMAGSKPSHPRPSTTTLKFSNTCPEMKEKTRRSPRIRGMGPCNLHIPYPYRMIGRIHVYLELLGPATGL